MDEKDMLPRELYKKIKQMDRKQMTVFVHSIYADVLEDIDYKRIEDRIGEVKGIGDVKREQIMKILHEELKVR